MVSDGVLGLNRFGAHCYSDAYSRVADGHQLLGIEWLVLPTCAGCTACRARPISAMCVGALDVAHWSLTRPSAGSVVSTVPHAWANLEDRSVPSAPLKEAHESAGTGQGTH